MQNLWNEWVTDNPMLGEAERAVRRVTRSGDNTKGVNIVALVFIGIFYVWILSVILRTRENVVAPLLFFELTLMNLVLPAAVYNALSGEFERATWESLVLTRLTTAQIVAGKWLWRFCLALLVSALFLLPLFLSLLVGDRGDRVSWGAAFQAKFLLLVWSGLLCSFGLWVSSRTGKSVTSISSIIGSLILVLVLLPIVAGLFNMPVGFDNGNMNAATLLINMLNPYILLSNLFGTSVSESAASGIWLGRGSVLHCGIGGVPSADLPFAETARCGTVRRGVK